MQRTALARPRRHGFTLIELLVIVAIIALLLAILMPTLDLARELTRRMVCGANQRSFGTACAAFSAGHTMLMPMCFHGESWSTPWLSGRCLRGGPGRGGYPTNDTLGEFDPSPRGTWENWRTHGTSWDTFEAYGTAVEMMECPTSVPEPWWTSPGHHGGGRLVTDYVYVGGLRAKPGTTQSADGPGEAPSATFAWGMSESIPAPAAAATDANLGDRVLLVDWVRFHWEAWGINHPDADDPERPDYQNILYADGHVEGRGRGYYADPLDEGNFSMLAPRNNGLVYDYWGQ
jgi:prepilin-type N-terminal cleavage/methylation domain-containing protein